MTVATFAGPSGGYTELALVNGVDLMKDGDFLLSFRTEQPDGLMLYTTDTKQVGVLTVVFKVSRGWHPVKRIRTTPHPPPRTILHLI